MEQSHSKFNYFNYLKISLWLSPILYALYLSIQAVGTQMSVMHYIATQPLATIMFFISCLGLLWYLLYQRQATRSNQGDLQRKSLGIYLISALIIGNLIGVGLSLMAIRQTPKSIHRSSIKELLPEWILFGATVFCSFVLIRIGLS